MTRADGAAPTVLVVDDQADIRQALEYLLSEEGFDVQQAANGREALELLARVRPSVILLDQSMPVMDGKTFVAALAADPAFASIPVIVLSAVPMLEPDALPPVFGGFFMKPFDVEAVIKAVRHWTASVGLAALLGITLGMASPPPVSPLVAAEQPPNASETSVGALR